MFSSAAFSNCHSNYKNEKLSLYTASIICFEGSLLTGSFITSASTYFYPQQVIELVLIQIVLFQYVHTLMMADALDGHECQWFLRWKLAYEVVWLKLNQPVQLDCLYIAIMVVVVLSYIHTSSESHEWFWMLFCVIICKLTTLTSYSYYIYINLIIHALYFLLSSLLLPVYVTNK